MAFYSTEAENKIYDTPPLVHLDYEVDVEYLLLLADNLRDEAKSWSSGEYQTDFWKMSHFRNDYIDSVMSDLNIVGEPRFVYHEPNTHLQPHTDFGTECCINFILSNDNTPINFEGQQFFYKNALLNVQRVHSVETSDIERVFLKISIKDKIFEEVLKEINYARYT